MAGLGARCEVWRGTRKATSRTQPGAMQRGKRGGGARCSVTWRDTATRNVWGPRQVGTLLPALTRPAFRRRSPATTQLLTDWTAIVGPALAAVTVPRRLSGTTLTLACTGPIAMELQHMTGELAAMINRHLGRVAVERLRFVQEMVPGPAAPPPPGVTDPPERIAGLPEGPLHDALARLGQTMRRLGSK